jgi:hypothetical protein
LVGWLVVCLFGWLVRLLRVKTITCLYTTYIFLLTKNKR